MLKPRLVVRNLFAMGSGHVIDRLLAMVLTAYLARVLGPAALGMVGIGMTMLRFGTALVVGGTQNLGVRAVARAPANIPDTYARVTGFRLLSALILVALGLATLKWVPGWLGIPANFLLMYLLILFVQSFALRWLFTGLEKMHIVAGLGITDSALALALTVAVVGGPDDLLRVPIAHLVATVAVVGWAQWWAHRRYAGLGINLNASALRETGRESLAISLSAWLDAIILQGAVVFLGILAHNTAMAGEFLASQRIVLTLYGLALLLPGVVFPATARLVHTDQAQAVDLQDRLIRINLTLLMPLVVAGVYFADEIVVILYGDGFAAAAMVLKLMLWSVPLVVMYNALRQTLMAAAIIRPIFVTALLGAVTHVLLAWLLIPEYGLRGAAIANISAFAVTVVSAVFYVHASLKRIPMSLNLAGPVAATAVGYAALVFTGNWHWIAQLAVFALAYGATALLTGSVSREELRTLLANLPGLGKRAKREPRE